MQPINIFAKWQVKEGELDTVLNLISQVAEQSRAEDGNLLYIINQSTTDPNTLLLAEAYQDEAALDAHRASAHFQKIVVGQIVPLLDTREVVITREISRV
ncbi:putative quinol monooxygenase [Mucilaginibacter myungsuensis]|uniref:Antibiotic biosynthesis monooxygenase n=1 Tax=Mucilaginibacter myungsuensis TaxID=649104 RepID=A0A929PZ41_9SPHI|nr:putative quinol monooxygenase [Mucilaginibacter myungsuensis]MBE9664115.1 antibiotic biosynthesis monooxygenase [Mucilaginibacter myungsuensis]MDN3601294.1 putative quinol monooxygenase [Mucilaginibacter myungsuensis]